MEIRIWREIVNNAEKLSLTSNSPHTTSLTAPPLTPQIYNMDKRNLAFGKHNFILLAVGIAIVIVGFILMSGGSSTETVFDADIFSARHIKVAPIVTFIGFISIIGAILYQPKDTKEVEK